MELYISVHKLDVSLTKLIDEKNLNRIFHSMHDSGNFNEETVTELISLIFNHYPKVLSLDHFTSNAAIEM